MRRKKVIVWREARRHMKDRGYRRPVAVLRATSKQVGRTLAEFIWLMAAFPTAANDLPRTPQVMMDEVNMRIASRR